MSAHYLKAKKVEATLLQVIEQPHTGRRLAIAVFPAPHEIDTAPAFLFGNDLDQDILDELRQAVIQSMQRQITRDFGRHASLKSELEQRERELEREEQKEQRKQLDLFQLRQQAREQFNQAAGNVTRYDDEGNPYPDIAPF